MVWLVFLKIQSSPPCVDSFIPSRWVKGFFYCICIMGTDWRGRGTLTRKLTVDGGSEGVLERAGGGLKKLNA